jgi:ABC-2 type transport system ATP-binding protein
MVTEDETVGQAGMVTTEAREPLAAAGAELLVEAQGLHKSYGPVTAVADLSFAVRRGEILGLLGPNGAGKSTALRMLVGFQYPDAGRVFLAGADVLRDGHRARASLGYLPESVPLYAEMPARRYLEFFAAIKGVRDIRAGVARVAERLDLGSVLDRPCGNLSRGYRQRVGLAQALLGDPSVLILDEPTSGLDPNQISDFRALLREVGREKAVLISTHILPEALEVCDRILILSRGRAVAEGSPATLAGGEAALHWARFRAPAMLSPGEGERFGLEVEGPPGPDGAVFLRAHRELDRDEARALLRHALDHNWELREWGAGAAGLERVFRRLTLGEGD